MTRRGRSVTPAERRTFRPAWGEGPGWTILVEAGQMLARVLTLRFDAALEAFDDEPLREFLKAREATAVREHLFVWNRELCPAILVPFGFESEVPDAT